MKLDSVLSWFFHRHRWSINSRDGWVLLKRWFNQRCSLWCGARNIIWYNISSIAFNIFLSTTRIADDYFCCKSFSHFFFFFSVVDPKIVPSSHHHSNILNHFILNWISDELYLVLMVNVGFAGQKEVDTVFVSMKRSFDKSRITILCRKRENNVNDSLNQKWGNLVCWVNVHLIFDGWSNCRQSTILGIFKEFVCHFSRRTKIYFDFSFQREPLNWPN